MMRKMTQPPSIFSTLQIAMKHNADRGYGMVAGQENVFVYF
jgi:hypothetical protein